MLKQIHGRGPEGVPVNQEIIQFKDAAWPAPFVAGLEYNSPCHGTWNIVHIGMAVPGAHQIYVCGANCNRGVVLTAAEMKASDRYSTITLFEDDLINGDMENLVIDGVTDVLDKLTARPDVVILFTVCVHRFMGVDLAYIYQKLRERFPEIIFVEGSMEPISQKDGLTPEQRLRDGMHSFLQADGKRAGCRRVKDRQKARQSGQEEKQIIGHTRPDYEQKTGPNKKVSILGSDFRIREDSEIKTMLKAAGYHVLETCTCKDIDEYLSMGSSDLFLCCYPTALHGVRKLSKRLSTPYLYLPASFSYEETDRQLMVLSEYLANSMDANALRFLPDTEALRQSCEKALAELIELVGDTAIAIDAHAVPRYLGLARLLLSHGFRVVRLYGDAFSPEEKEDYEWLRQNAPELTLCSMIHPKMRVFPRGQEEKMLAVGQKAAYFHQTPYFVNIVQGEGLHGYAGILQLINWMKEAYQTPKDTRDLVGRKGLGCETY